MNQADVEIVPIKDYIKNRRRMATGALHMIVLIDVSFFNHKDKVPIGDTVSYNCHEFLGQQSISFCYKKSRIFTEEMQQELKKCADIMADADDKLQNLANVSGIVQPIE